MVKVVLKIDFSCHKKGDTLELDSLIASSLVKRKVAEYKNLISESEEIPTVRKVKKTQK